MAAKVVSHKATRHGQPGERERRIILQQKWFISKVFRRPCWLAGRRVVGSHTQVAQPVSGHCPPGERERGPQNFHAGHHHQTHTVLPANVPRCPATAGWVAQSSSSHFLFFPALASQFPCPSHCQGSLSSQNRSNVGSLSFLATHTVRWECSATHNGLSGQGSPNCLPVTEEGTVHSHACSMLPKGKCSHHRHTAFCLFKNVPQQREKEGWKEPGGMQW